VLLRYLTRIGVEEAEDGLTRLDCVVILTLRVADPLVIDRAVAAADDHDVEVGIVD
jgi:hypothetical protein